MLKRKEASGSLNPVETLTKTVNTKFETQAEAISSILVKTGVFQGDLVSPGAGNVMNLAHKDTVIDSTLTRPKHITQDVFEAVKLVFQMEKFM
jgi:hypothetical protein